MITSLKGICVAVQGIQKKVNDILLRAGIPVLPIIENRAVMTSQSDADKLALAVSQVTELLSSDLTVPNLRKMYDTLQVIELQLNQKSKKLGVHPLPKLLPSKPSITAADFPAMEYSLQVIMARLIDA